MKPTWSVKIPVRKAVQELQIRQSRTDGEDLVEVYKTLSGRIHVLVFKSIRVLEYYKTVYGRNLHIYVIS
jgi:hypothetical protein